jgi:toxin YoeB
MQITYTPKAKEHLDFWVRTGNKSVLKRILLLTKAIIDNPYEGIGKPEALKHELVGYWSRRINSEHRFVYTIIDGGLIIQSLKGHYR